jgi:hypothetical protein
MINTVRNTVMAILNKDNNGYITPEEFNLFAKQAQLEIFEQYFYDYTNWVNKRNARLANDGYANIQKNISETIDEFSTSSTLVYDAPSQSFALPADWYYVNVVLYGTKEIEYVAQNKVMNLLSSNITAPSTAYPAYYQKGDDIKVYPASITSSVSAMYVRYPLDPKWTYDVVAGSPIFNQSLGDYQDFELPQSEQNDLVFKILSYAGVNIREAEVVQFATGSDNAEQTKQS